MIKPAANRKIPFPGPRRRRVSNQLAAFAAIMLFASTQVTSPEPSDTGEPGAAVDPVVRSAERSGHDDSGRAQPENPADEVAQVVSQKTGKDKGLDLSLFLLPR